MTWLRALKHQNLAVSTTALLRDSDKSQEIDRRRTSIHRSMHADEREQAFIENTSTYSDFNHFSDRPTKCVL